MSYYLLQYDGEVQINSMQITKEMAKSLTGFKDELDIGLYWIGTHYNNNAFMVSVYWDD